MSNTGSLYSEKVVSDYQKEIKDLKFNLKRAEDSLDEQMEKNEDLALDLKHLKCKYDAERCARAPRLWRELKQEMKKVTEHRDRLLRFHHRDTKKLKNMKEDWEVATEKIANENADLREQIKKLKKKDYEKFEKELDDVCSRIVVTKSLPHNIVKNMKIPRKKKK